MGGSSSKSVENTLDLVNETIINSMMEVNNSCQSNASTSQSLVITGFDYTKCMTDALSAINELKNPVPPNFQLKMVELCEKGIAEDVSISGIQQTSNVKIMVECEFSNEQASEITSKVANDLSQKMDNETDAISNVLSDLVTTMGAAVGADSDDSLTNKQKIENIMKTEIDNKFYNSVSSQLAASQSLLISAMGAKKFSVSDVKQTVNAEAIMGAMASNSAILSAIQEVDNKTSQELKNKENGFADIINSILTAGPMALGAIAVVCVVLILFSAGIGPQRGGGSKRKKKSKYFKLYLKNKAKYMKLS